ncbi:MAG: hypothetical protein KAG18_08805 [Sinobacterium sp.]|nr:hypothetical protein [Sinobacterium sp.]
MSEVMHSHFLVSANIVIYMFRQSISDGHFWLKPKNPTFFPLISPVK